MNEEKIKEVFSDKDFVGSLLELETAEEVQSAISKKGIDLSISDIEVLRAQLANSGEELSEEDLENVAGGFGRPTMDDPRYKEQMRINTMLKRGMKIDEIQKR